MRLAAKLILLFLSGLFLIVVAFAALTISREKQIAVEQHQRYAAEIADLAERLEQRRDAESRRQGFSGKSEIRIRRVELTATDNLHSPSVPRDRLFVSEEITTITMPDSSGIDRLYTYVPVPPDESPETDESKERYEVSAPDVDSDDRLLRMMLSSLLTLLSVAGLSGLVIYFGGIRMVGRPLDQLIDKVHQVAAGDLDQPVRVSTRDELGDLGKAINQMCDCLSQQRSKIESETEARIAAVEQLRHADRLRSVGRIAAGIAHEIGTPLNVVSGHAELIESGELSDEMIRTSCRQIKTETDRIARIISNVLEFARGKSSHRKPTDVRKVVEETCELLRPMASKARATIRTSLPEHPVVAKIDSGQIKQVLTNLINNAVQSAERDTEVDVSVTQREDDGLVETRLVVADNGDGIAPEDRDHLFEPFFTTKDVGKGTGLGLAIALGIVHDHGGEILVESRRAEDDSDSQQPASGSRFTVVLRDRQTALA